MHIYLYKAFTFDCLFVGLDIHFGYRLDWLLVNWVKTQPPTVDVNGQLELYQMILFMYVRLLSRPTTSSHFVVFRISSRLTP